MCMREQCVSTRAIRPSSTSTRHPTHRLCTVQPPIQSCHSVFRPSRYVTLRRPSFLFWHPGWCCRVVLCVVQASRWWVDLRPPRKDSCVSLAHFVHIFNKYLTWEHTRII